MGWAELEKLQSLRVLDLADCSIDLTISEFYTFVLAPLKKIHKLEYVNFMGNPVEKNVSEFKYFIINEMPKLKYLDWDPITKSVCPVQVPYIQGVGLTMHYRRTDN